MAKKWHLIVKKSQVEPWDVVIVSMSFLPSPTGLNKSLVEKRHDCRQHTACRLIQQTQANGKGYEMSYSVIEMLDVIML